MGLKLINVDDKKWKAFRKYCFDNEITMKAEIDKFLNKFEKGEKK